MKKVIFTLMIALAIISCSDDDTNLVNSNESQTALSVDKTQATNSKSEITYMPLETFEEDLEDYMQVILEENPGTHIMVNMVLDESTNTYAVTNEPSPSEPSDPHIRRKVICRGDLGTVEKCVLLYKRHGIGFGDCSYDANSQQVLISPPVWQHSMTCPD